jgi:hypothetical protein
VSIAVVQLCFNYVERQLQALNVQKQADKIEFQNQLKIQEDKHRDVVRFLVRNL